MTSDKPSADRLSPGQLLELYYFLKLNRGLEEKLSNLYRQGKVVGGLYRSLGQEACSIGSAYALERGDIFTPLIRNLGAILVRGGSPHDIFCQYMAKADSPTRGRDLNVHFGWLSPEGSMPSVISFCAPQKLMRRWPSMPNSLPGTVTTRTRSSRNAASFWELFSKALKSGKV